MTVRVVSQAGTWGRGSQAGLRMMKGHSPAACGLGRGGSSSYLLDDWVILFIGHTRGSQPPGPQTRSVRESEKSELSVSCSANTPGAHPAIDTAPGGSNPRQTEDDLPTSIMESTVDGPLYNLWPKKRNHQTRGANRWTQVAPMGKNDEF